MSGLFEHLAATDDSAIVAHRKATAVANKRVKDRFGAFFANASDDARSRLALVEDDITTLVNDVVSEHGGDAAKITAAIKQSLLGTDPLAGGGMQSPGMGGPGMGAPGTGAPGGLTPGAGGTNVCPQCGGPMVNGQCPKCQTGAGAQGGAAGAPAGAYGLTHSMPQMPSTGPVQASVKEARRPKMCPYHSEVVDVSLGSGDPQAGYNAMSSHAWGDNHCKGGYEGTCNFRPGMVTQKFWDDHNAELDQRREQREIQRNQEQAQQVLGEPILDPEPELSIDTEPIMHAEPLSVEPGKEGVSDIDGELANAPSAIGAGDLAMAASTHKEAEALKTVDLPTGDASALGGPSPKIDKAKSGDNLGWNLDPIDTQMDGTPHPTVDADPTDKAEYDKKDFLDQTNAVSKQESLPTGKGLDGGGFNTTRNITQSPTKTWSGQEGQHDPVTRDALSSRTGAEHWIENAVKKPGQLHKDLDVPEDEKIPEDKLEEAEHSDNKKERERAQFAENMKGLKKGTVDPDKNPLAEILEEYSGHLLPNQVEAALKDWPVG